MDRKRLKEALQALELKYDGMSDEELRDHIQNGSEGVGALLGEENCKLAIPLNLEQIEINAEDGYTDPSDTMRLVKIAKAFKVCAKSFDEGHVDPNILSVFWSNYFNVFGEE